MKAALFLISVLFLAFPGIVFGGEDDFDTITIKPIGVDYSKYSGTDKLFMVGECESVPGNQIVIFQNRPSFDFFENDQTYVDEQKELEKAIWAQIHRKDAEPMVLKGRWHKFNEKMVFLCHQIMKMEKNTESLQ